MVLSLTGKGVEWQARNGANRAERGIVKKQIAEKEDCRIKKL